MPTEEIRSGDSELRQALDAALSGDKAACTTIEQLLTSRDFRIRNYHLVSEAREILGDAPSTEAELEEPVLAG